MRLSFDSGECVGEKIGGAPAEEYVEVIGAARSGCDFHRAVDEY